MKEFKIILISIFFGTVFFLTHYNGQFFGLNRYDEGINVFTAVNILDGKIPYRDFYITKPPGYFLFLASVFKVFGISLINTRIAELFLQSLSVTMAVYLAIYSSSLLLGIITALFLLIFRTGIMLGAVPLILFELILLFRFIKLRNNIYLFISGLTGGFISFFRLDFSIYVLVISAVNIIFRRWITYRQNKKVYNSFIAYINLLINKELFFYLLGFIFGLLPIIVFISMVGFQTSWQHLIVYAHITAVTRYFSYPPLIPDIIADFMQTKTIPIFRIFQRIMESWPYYLPYIVSLVTMVDLVLRRNYYTVKEQAVFLLKILLTSGVLVFSAYMQFRPDLDHARPVFFFVFILFPSFLEALYHLLDRSKLFKIVVFIFIALSLFMLTDEYMLNLLMNYIYALSPLIIIIIAGKYFKPFFAREWPAFLVIAFFGVNLLYMEYYRIARSNIIKPADRILLSLPKAHGIYISQTKDKDYDQLINYLIDKNSHGDYLFIGSTRHDMIYVNDVMLYFLTGTRSPTRYWFYDTGIQSTPEIQHEMVVDLEKTKPKLAVLWTKASVKAEKGENLESQGVTTLDDYIRNQYIPIKQFGDYFVLERKDLYEKIDIDKADYD